MIILFYFLFYLFSHLYKNSSLSPAKTVNHMPAVCLALNLITTLHLEGAEPTQWPYVTNLSFIQVTGNIRL